METTPKGKLYLIPITLGENDPLEVLPYTVQRIIEVIDIYIVDNEKYSIKDIQELVECGWELNEEKTKILYKL